VPACIALLQSSAEDVHALFPYQKFDSAQYCILSGYDSGNSGTANPRRFSRVISLCPQKASLLVHLVNNPAHFGPGDCSNSKPAAVVLYYAGGKEIASLRFNCQGHGLQPDPGSILSLKGHLNTKGDSLIHLIKPWE
jgi:hypothetical protein